MDDAELVARLGAWSAEARRRFPAISDTMDEAADHIEALTAKAEALAEALRWIASAKSGYTYTAARKCAADALKAWEK